MENEKKIKVVLLEPGKLARAAEIDASLAGMQKTVGGLIEPFYPFEEQVCIVCNEESSLPAALVRYLAEHPHIRRVVLRLDNDTTGRIAAGTIKALLPRKYAVTVDIQPPPQGKDYNDCLCMRLGLPITKRGERNKER